MFNFVSAVERVEDKMLEEASEEAYWACVQSPEVCREAVVAYITTMHEGEFELPETIDMSQPWDMYAADYVAACAVNHLASGDYYL
jgi:hypothetical protein